MFQVTAVCTTRQETAQETAHRFNIPLAFSNVEELVRHPDVDMVDVCVRLLAHHEIVMAALRAGKHVFCEWPLGVTTAEAEDMAKEADARGVLTMIGFQRRGSPTFNQLRALIADGYVGRVLSSSLTSFGAGYIWRQPSLTWAADKRKGVSTVSIAGGHNLDALCYALGDELREVAGTVSTQVKSSLPPGATEPVEITAPDNALISGTLAGGGQVSAHIASVPHLGAGYRLEIYGTEGTLVASAVGAQEITVAGGRGGDKAVQPIAVSSAHTWVPAGVPEGPPFNVGQIFQQFGEAILAGRKVEADFTLAVRRHRLLDAIQAASDTGKRQAVADWPAARASTRGGPR